MKTLYTFDKFGNVGVHILMLVFIGLLLIGLIRIYPFLHTAFRIVKAFFCRSIARDFGDCKRHELALMISVPLVSVVILVGLIAACINLMCLNERDRVNVPLSKCERVEGLLDDFTYIDEYYNHGQDIVYKCSFTVEGIRFDEVPIDADPEKIILNELMSGAYFTVYYQNKFDKNLVSRIDMHVHEIATG